MILFRCMCEETLSSLDRIKFPAKQRKPVERSSFEDQEYAHAATSTNGTEVFKDRESRNDYAMSVIMTALVNKFLHVRLSISRKV